MIHHPDLVRLPSAVRWLWVEGLVWSRLNRTDGLIPKHMLVVVSIEPNAVEKADQLVLAGRWTDEGDAYQMVGFSASQMTRERVEQKQRSASERWDKWQASQLSSTRTPTRYQRVAPSRERGAKGRQRVENVTDPTRPDPKG
ncbi:MAG: hypothetical protein ACHQ01_08010, partial [Candidatus Limnocylindrales bacterium]